MRRYLIICALATPTAVAVWLVFHGVFATLTRTEAAMGYVDSTTQIGIYLGYVSMVGGTAIFAGIAAWAGVRAGAAWLDERRKR